jgi:hypothetical protein
MTPSVLRMPILAEIAHQRDVMERPSLIAYKK